MPSSSPRPRTERSAVAWPCPLRPDFDVNRPLPALPDEDARGSKSTSVPQLVVPSPKPSRTRRSRPSTADSTASSSSSSDRPLLSLPPLLPFSAPSSPTSSSSCSPSSPSMPSSPSQPRKKRFSLASLTSPSSSSQRATSPSRPSLRDQISAPIASFNLADEIEERCGPLYFCQLAQVTLRSPKMGSRESWGVVPKER
ncbi:hypothetical protein JCM8547_004462 [Rhodosporidiobolus lusitaniae]